MVVILYPHMVGECQDGKGQCQLGSEEQKALSWGTLLGMGEGDSACPAPYCAQGSLGGM